MEAGDDLDSGRSSPSDDHVKVVESSEFKAPAAFEGKDSSFGASADSDKNLPVIPDPLTTDPVPEGVFYIEVIKNGSVILRKEIDKPRITFGRSRDADFPMEHPSLSRYHACVLWNPKDRPHGSFFLIDLNSVHGTIVNKTKIPGGKPIKINTGNDIIKFGASSRLFVLGTTLAPNIEEEEAKEEARRKKEAQEKEDQGCTWGFQDDNDDEDDEGGEGDSLGTPLGKVLYILQTGGGTTGPTPNDHAYSENPQKSIQQWFDSEGYDFEYKVDFNNGMFKCTIELPFDGQDVPIDGEPAPKKKDALINVCLRACQVLDKAELLFPWQRQKDFKRKKNDSSDSDDEVMDETDQYKHKKAKRLAIKSGITEILNFDNLNERWKEISQELQKLKVKAATLSLASKNQVASTNKPEEDGNVKKTETEDENVDALDAFMDDIKHTDEKPMKTSLNVKIEQSKLRMTIADLEKEQLRVERLIKIAKPSFTLPALESVYSTQSTEKSEIVNKNSSQPDKKVSLASDKSSTVKINLNVKIDGESIRKDSQQSFEVTQAIKPEPGKIAISLIKKSLIQKPASAFTEEPEEKIKPKGPFLPSSSLSPLPKPSSSLSQSTSSEGDEKFGLIIKKTDKSKSERPKLVKETPNYFDQEAYVEWLPPKGQTGDGKTALNDKYGY